MNFLSTNKSSSWENCNVLYPRYILLVKSGQKQWGSLLYYVDGQISQLIIKVSCYFITSPCYSVSGSVEVPDSHYDSNSETAASRNASLVTSQSFNHFKCLMWQTQYDASPLVLRFCENRLLVLLIEISDLESFFFLAHSWLRMVFKMLF